MSKWLKRLVIVILLLVFIIGGIRLLKIRMEEVASTPPPEKPVYVVEGAVVKKGSIQVEDQFLGLFRPFNTVQVSSKLSGYIKKIHVKTGQFVKKGQVVLTVDDTPVKTQIETTAVEIQNVKSQLKALSGKKEALKIDLETKRKIYERNKRLYEKKAIPLEAVEKSYAVYKIAQSNYNDVVSNISVLEGKIKQLREKMASLEDELGYLRITSPVDGVVQRINVREGNLVVPGKPVLNIESSDRYEIIVKLPPDYPVKEGDSLVVDFNGSKKELKVMMVCPSASPEFLKVIKTRIGYRPEGVASNSFLNVSLKKELSGYVVPLNAVLELTGKKYLLIYRDGGFQKVEVELLGTDGVNAVVKGNIQEGMEVAVAQQSKLRLLAFGKKGKLVLKESGR
ncbi:MAG: efflux RND transporter periplasmic adaptor subunit [Aquificae bacterium]|nr:efflux RND transporter periplasmic adaptor subunit [Aquificota bacterium]